MKYIPFEELEKEWMKDPEFVKEMAKQEPEFQLARSLIEARIKRKLTQSKVAKIAKTDQATISRLESGVSKPSISLLQKVAAALGARLSIRFEI
ncbi:MAG: helix-turn-helix transcriptional regulator [Patescibacteria group bacterium]